jgi:hypothetical protein
MSKTDKSVSLYEIATFLESDEMWLKLLEYKGKFDPEQGVSRTLTFVKQHIIEHFTKEKQ